jgi:hypothetical protein
MKMKIINGLHRTLCPTFPRSGNTFVMLTLGDYFGTDRFRFADVYKFPEQGFQKDPKCVMQKTHDFDFVDQPQKQWKQLVQIRNPLDALASWQVLKTKEGTAPNKPRQWWKEQMDYYAKFVKKWILDDVPNRLVVTYEKLMADPVGVMCDIVLFIEHEPRSVDFERMGQIVGIRLKRTQGIYPRPYVQL